MQVIYYSCGDCSFSLLSLFSSISCSCISIDSSFAVHTNGSRTHGAERALEHSVGSRGGAECVGSRNGADCVGSRGVAGSGADSVGSQNGAGSGADSVGSRGGAGSGADSMASRAGAGSEADSVTTGLEFTGDMPAARTDLMGGSSSLHTHLGIPGPPIGALQLHLPPLEELQPCRPPPEAHQPP